MNFSSIVTVQVYFCLGWCSWVYHNFSDFVHSRYLQEDKPHGSAGGLYKFKDFLMEDDPVILRFTPQGNAWSLMCLLQALWFLKGPILDHHFSLATFGISFNFNLACLPPIYIVRDSFKLMGMSDYVQDDIVVLNCDVCCSFPLAEMLGMLQCSSLFQLSIGHFYFHSP
jgi:hypothetical protein